MDFLSIHSHALDVRRGAGLAMASAITAHREPARPNPDPPETSPAGKHKTQAAAWTLPNWEDMPLPQPTTPIAFALDAVARYCAVTSIIFVGRRVYIKLVRETLGWLAGLKVSGRIRL